MVPQNSRPSINISELTGVQVVEVERSDRWRMETEGEGCVMDDSHELFEPFSGR